MFSPRTPNVKAKASPFMRQKLQRSGASTPGRNYRNRNVSNIANQSLHTSQMFADESTQGKYQIEAFGAPLPVLITEALTMSDRSSTEITACIDPSGWAWLVGGRKLFVWQYGASKSSRNVQCKELILPPSDLAHSAERVCLIPSENAGQPAACVAVSPEGVVRYWPNIAFESSTAEMNAELKGEECARVINFQPHGCLLATTTSSLLLLQPTPGQTSISCKPLTSSQGLFSGISRRMSSFIFGASQLQTNGLPLQAIIASPEDEYDNEDDDIEDCRSFYVLSGNHLNKWQVPSIGPERLLYQVDADRLFREALARKVWDQDSIQLPQLKTWLLDLHLTREGVVILGAGVNLEVTNPTMYYALAYLETYDDAQPANVSDLALMDFTQQYREEEEDQLTNFKLLSPVSLKSNSVFVYNNSSILVMKDENCEKMDLRSSGDKILGAGNCNGTAVFFSNTHGIFSVSQPHSEHSFVDESTNHTMSRAEMSSMLGNISKMAENTESEGGAATLKDAFIASISGDQDLAQSLVDSLTLLTRPDPGAKGSELDHVTAAVSKDLIDDFPSADPRWAESSKHDSTSSTASVIIVQQLKDKEKAHDFFVSFLKKFGLWNQLGIVSVRDSMMPTRLLLCEHVEKLEAAVALRELHAENHKLVDACIRTVLAQRNAALPQTLTPQDVFYREASNISEIVQVLIDYETEQLAKDQRSQTVVELVLAVNSILEAMFHQALLYRQSHTDMYTGSDNDVIPEYIPWTATTTMRNAIIKQISLSLEKGIPLAREVDVQGIMYQNVVGLADIIMDGYASQVKSLECSNTATEDCAKLKQKFEQERHRLILPLLEHKQYDRAAALAEKFEDFEMLMRICDATENQDRLHRYRMQFADKGFSQFVFKWFMKEGKRGHLLAQPMAQGDELSKFLDADNVRYLSWVHEISRGNLLAAHTSLSHLASTESNFLSKKKTLLSLSKLAALASEEEGDNLRENLEAVNEELDLVMHQEQLPRETLENVGMDPDNMRVLSPEELIELYVSEKNEGANELDVKKALDLLHYVDKSSDEEAFEALKLHIWCRAILIDSWQEESSHPDPLEANRDKIFFRTVDLVHLCGELQNLLPDLNSLLSAEELQPLCQQPHFQFLMRGGYEQIRNVLSTMD